MFPSMMVASGSPPADDIDKEDGDGSELGSDAAVGVFVLSSSSSAGKSRSSGSLAHATRPATLLLNKPLSKFKHLYHIRLCGN
jgi:hypothetical protein